MTLDIQPIPLSRLVHSKSNVRRTGKSRGIDALSASIKAHGLRQNLNVRAIPGGRFEVIAGGRRLDALRRLMKAGEIANDTAIPCALLNAEDDGRELSLVENSLREAMHPDDQCTAFGVLIEQGSDIEGVAARFGLTSTIVRQRLRLASVSPKLRARFRKDEIDLSQMMAFALVDDHTAQERVWDDLPDWNRDPDAIRRALTSEGLSASHRLAVFVGIDAYEAAGGMVLRDLFDEEREASLTDAGLVDRLALARLEDEAASLRAEGWKWVSVATQPDHTTHYDRVYPHACDRGEPAEFASADKARAGARLYVDYSGELRIERGLVDPNTQRAERRAGGKAGTAAVLYPEPLVQSLTAHRTAALRLELIRRPDVALASVVHALALRLIYQAYDVPTCLSLTATSRDLPHAAGDTAECPAHAELAGIVEHLSETLPDPGALWAWCLAQDQQALLSLLAVLSALSIDAVTRLVHPARDPRIRHADALAEALKLDMHAHWSPSAEGFFMRLSKGAMQTLLKEGDQSQHADLVGKSKKLDAALRTARVLGDTYLPGPLMAMPVISGDDQQHDDDLPDDEDEDQQDDDQHQLADA